ncbi:MAG: OmpH family outer membrane protein [Acidobacteria bacterium]|nr:OmpH family outer membrane protein [Acidobacteriota bacterium]
MIKMVFRTALFAVVIGFATVAMAQVNIAVIDIQRVVTDSDAGKEALGRLQQLQEAKIAEGRAIQERLDALREQLSKQRFTLTEAKVAELSKEIEDKGIEMRRFQDDAQRELDEARRTALGGLEERILPVIDEVGIEKNMTLIFNKFQSGLVYASEGIDITDEVIRRFNTAQ